MLEELLNNEYFVWGAMALIIFLLTQILKLPIKLATKHIKNERARRMVNATILLIPFALGVALEFVYSTYYLKTAFSIINGLGYGTTGISLYAIIERSFKVKTTNPYNSSEGMAVLELVEDITKDGKIDGADKEIAKNFFDKLNSVK